MGGRWERQIRSVRSILSALMEEHSHTLDDESLRTLLTDVECIVDSRSLTFPSRNHEDLDPPKSHTDFEVKCHHPPTGKLSVSFECLLVEMEKRVGPKFATESEV